MAGLGSYGYGSVGGAAASGLQSGFDMSLRANAQADQRKQREFENARQTASDARQAMFDQRTIARQDKLDANAEDDRAMAGLNSSMEDARYQLGALHATYGDKPIPDAEAKPLYSAVGDLSAKRQALLQKRYQPVIDATTQKWRDFSSRAQAGDPGSDPSQLRGNDLREYIKATTGHDLTEFANGNVGKGINDATAGLSSKNMPMVINAADTLLGPQIKKNLGGVAPDGSQIVDKSLYALVPAPQQGMQPGQQNPALSANPVQGLSAALTAATGGAPPQGQQPQGPPPQQPGMQPGSDPGLVMPVLQVTTRQPDGRITSYHAPMTDGRGTGPNDKISAPIRTQDLMDRMGRLGVVDNWLRTPQMQQAVQEALQDKSPTTFDQAWAAVHGDPKVLNGTNVTDPTSVKIAAIKKLAAEQYGGDFTAAAQAMMGHIGAPSPTGAPLTSTKTAPAPTGGGTSVTNGPFPAKTDVAGTQAVGAALNPPGDQAGRNAEQLKILQDEKTSKWEPALASAKATGDPAQIAKAQGNLDTINREITKVQSTPAPAAAPTAAPPASTVLGAAPTNTNPDDKKTIDFYAAADIAGDRNWRVGLSRSKSGSALIEAVKRRIPSLAEEWGITPQDYGTIVGQRASLNGTLKQVTSRAAANEASADKVTRDMKTYDALLDGSASDYGPKFANVAINELRRQFNDPKLAALDTAANQVGLEYERMMQGGQLSVGQLHAGAAEDAKKLINGDMAPAVARAKMQVMLQEIQNAKETSRTSVDNVTEKLRNLGGNPAKARTGTGLTPPAASASEPAGKVSFATADEAQAEAAAGRLKPGTRITINGRSGTWQ
jgi:hypothetical protein